MRLDHITTLCNYARSHRLRAVAALLSLVGTSLVATAAFADTPTSTPTTSCAAGTICPDGWPWQN